MHLGNELFILKSLEKNSFKLFNATYDEIACFNVNAQEECTLNLEEELLSFLLQENTITFELTKQTYNIVLEEEQFKLATKTYTYFQKNEALYSLFESLEEVALVNKESIAFEVEGFCYYAHISFVKACSLYEKVACLLCAICKKETTYLQKAS